jgi:hypothetical protein
MPVLKAQSPEFKPWSHQKKKVTPSKWDRQNKNILEGLQFYLSSVQSN